MKVSLVKYFWHENGKLKPDFIIIIYEKYYCIYPADFYFVLI